MGGIIYIDKLLYKTEIEMKEVLSNWPALNITSKLTNNKFRTANQKNTLVYEIRVSLVIV